MLGISVYFKDLNKNYLTKAAKVGARYVFTSLQIPEEDHSQFNQKLPQLINQCKNLGLDLIPDISPAIWKMLRIEEGNFQELKEEGFTALRLDDGFNDFNLVKKLQQDFIILLNASVITPKYLDEAEKNGINISQIVLTYNFYPHTDTGMSWEDFKKKNWLFKDCGLRTQAFVPGDVLKRFPLYEGLTTVEKHRGLLPYVAAVELMHEASVDDIFIGDSEASVKQLKYIVDYQKYKILNLECHLLPNYQNLYNQVIEARKDIPEKIIRLKWPRVPDVIASHTLTRNKGTIVMQNKLAQRYSGELSLTKTDLPFEARSNVIGFISPEFVDLLNYIDADTKIILRKIV